MFFLNFLRHNQIFDKKKRKQKRHFLESFFAKVAVFKRVLSPKIFWPQKLPEAKIRFAESRFCFKDGLPKIDLSFMVGLPKIYVVKQCQR